VLCINGAVLGLEGILQRLSGTNKLLWAIQPRINYLAEAQFGPYAYRSNAAQYLNLLWPVCLGFWVVLRKANARIRRAGARIGESSHVVLLPATVIMAACPVISTSRGGAIVAAIGLILSAALLWRMVRQEPVGTRLGLLTLFLTIVCFSGYLGWAKLSVRLRTIFEDQMSRRTEIYENAVPIARDFPTYGTGAGTFSALYQLYRAQPKQDWAAYVHDDWLETRITLGWVGFCVAVGMLGIVILKPLGTGGGIRLPWEIVGLIWLALGGCLLHAKFDFPFQIYSVVFLFLLLCVIQFCATARRSTPP
jgi:hypothetical protein